jgi:hypothetical protein
MSQDLDLVFNWAKANVLLTVLAAKSDRGGEPFPLEVTRNGTTFIQWRLPNGQIAPKDMIPKDYSGGGVDPQVKSNFDKAFSDPQAAIKELADGIGKAFQEKGDALAKEVSSAINSTKKEGLELLRKEEAVVQDAFAASCDAVSAGFQAVAEFAKDRVEIAKAKSGFDGVLLRVLGQKAENVQSLNERHLDAKIATAHNAGMVGAMVAGLLATAVLDAPLLIATFPMVAGYLYGSTFPDDKVVEKEGQKYIKPGRSILQLVNEKQAAHEKKLTTKLNDLLRKLIPDAKVKESLQNYIELLIKKGKIDPKNSDPRCILQYLGIYQ